MVSSRISATVATRHTSGRTATLVTTD
jgi:hypothetical protein